LKSKQARAPWTPFRGSAVPSRPPLARSMKLSQWRPRSCRLPSAGPVRRPPS
jgi:hypothetical protein